LRARKYEEKIKSANTGNLVRECWEEKQSYCMIGTIDMVRRERIIIIGTRIELREIMGHRNESFEKDLINRERDLQRQWEKQRIDRDQGIIKDTKR